MRTALISLSLLALIVAGCPSAEPDDHVCMDLTRLDVQPGSPAPEGLEATSDGELIVRLLSADPIEPDVGENLWEVEVVDADGARVQGCTATVVPFMPDHGHGVSEAPLWTAIEEAPGTYQISNLNFIMAGFWEVTIGDLTCDEMGPEDAVYSFCAEG